MKAVPNPEHQQLRLNTLLSYLTIVDTMGAGRRTYGCKHARTTEWTIRTCTIGLLRFSN
jgi:hypothetical protein